MKWKKRTENISRQINLEVRVHLCLHLADPAGLENHAGHHLHPLLLSSHPPSVCLYLCVCTEFVCLLFEYLKLQFWFFSCQSSSIPISIGDVLTIPHICHRHHRRCLCKKKLPGVNFYISNAKKGNLLCNELTPSKY